MLGLFELELVESEGALSIFCVKNNKTNQEYLYLDREMTRLPRQVLPEVVNFLVYF